MKSEHLHQNYYSKKVSFKKLTLKIENIETFVLTKFQKINLCENEEIDRISLITEIQGLIHCEQPEILSLRMRVKQVFSEEIGQDLFVRRKKRSEHLEKEAENPCEKEIDKERERYEK